MKTVLVTTSWDDGHALDLKLAALLKKHSIAGTFYISPEDGEFSADELLSDHEVRILSKDFEIGAHTQTHPHLAKLSRDDIKREVTSSKICLENILRRPVNSFCYPYGSYNDSVKEVVKEAGFTFARTVAGFQTSVKDRYAAGTSVHVFDHKRDGLSQVIKLAGWRLWRVPQLIRWDNLGKELFAQARQTNGVFHLWGHSHEIEALGHWDRLEAFLIWLKKQPNVRFITNSQIPICAPKVLVTAPYFKPHSGGLEEYAFEVSKGLQSQYGWDVVVATSGSGDETTHDVYQGLPVHRLPYRIRLSNTPFGFGWRRALKQLIVAEKPDVIVGHSPVPGMVDVTASAAGKTPFVVTYHMGSMKKGGGLVDVLIGAYEKFVLPLTIRKATTVICASEFTSRSFLAKYTAKSTVITPGVDTDRFGPAKQKAPAHSLMHIGGLKPGEEHKGLETTLRVVAQLKVAYPDIHLSVVGNGEWQSRYVALARELGITKQVTFRGLLSGAKLVAAYRSVRVVLVPSRKESFGMTIIEAMACGVPVVASDTEGIPLVVENGVSGVLVAPDDIDGFASAVSKLFDDAVFAKHMAATARQRAISHYQWTDRIAETNSVLLKAASILEPNRQTTDSKPTKGKKQS